MNPFKSISKLLGMSGEKALLGQTAVSDQSTIHSHQGENNFAQRSKQSGNHCYGAFGRCKGPFDPRPALKPEQMRLKYLKGKAA